jgi:hypothetical protein
MNGLKVNPQGVNYLDNELFDKVMFSTGSLYCDTCKFQQEI